MNGLLDINWIDLMIGVLLVVGMYRGRKRGMSEELLDILKWASIVVVAGLLYEPAGRFLAEVSVFSLLASYVFVYFALALVIFIVFALIRRSIGEKLVESDTFGRTEYYLGMVAGGFRYVCVVLVLMAFLNARHYSEAEIQASLRYQHDNFGSSFFPTLHEMQHQVFDRSLSGRLTQNYLHVVLIRPTAPDGKGLEEKSIARRREGTMHEILDRR